MKDLGLPAAKAVYRRALALLEAGAISRDDLCLLETLIFRCREFGGLRAKVSYKKILKLIRMARGTTAKCLNHLEQAGLILARIKGWVFPTKNGVTYAQRDTNAYEIPAIPPMSPESTVKEERFLQESYLSNLHRTDRFPEIPDVVQEALNKLEAVMLKRREQRWT